MRSMSLLSICFLSLQITYLTGYVLYNWEKNLCCEGKVHPIQSSDGKIQNCCGNKVMILDYEAKTYNKCCNGEIRDSVEFFDPNFQCCNKELINTTKYACFNNTDSIIILESDQQAKKTQICGKSLEEIQFYNYRSGECCEGNYHPKELQKKCVGPDYVPSKDNIFCIEPHEYKVHSLKNKNQHKIQCCGLEIYNTDKQACILNKIFNKNEEITKHCCGFTYTYNWTVYWWDLTEKTNDADDEDCDNSFIASEDYNCNNNVLYRPSQNESTCLWNSQKYNTQTQACCFSQIVNLTEEEKNDGNFQCCEEGTPNSMFGNAVLY